jgi:hypothetical protein
MMDETETFDARFDSQVRGIGKGGVTPPPSEFVFFARVLGVMEQQIHAPAEIYVFLPTQPTLMFETEFIVGQEYKGFALLNEFITVSAIGVTEWYWRNLHSVQAAMAGFHVWTFTAKIKFGSQKVKVHGEVRCLHLMGEISSYGILSMWAATESDVGILRIGRLKKRKTKQMVPVRMSEEKTNMSNLFFLR